MDLNELLRLLLNLIRKGSVIAVDHAAPKCRVETGGLVTNWVPWITLRAGTTRTWNPPTVGEQVLLISPGGDAADAVVLCGIFSDDATAPSASPSKDLILYPDGAVIEYDHVAHALSATLPAGGSAVLTAPASVTVNSDGITLNAPLTTCTGQLLVKKLITGQGGIAISGSDGGGSTAQITVPMHVTENITSDSDIKAGDISLRNHHHTEQGDGAATSAAQA